MGSVFSRRIGQAVVIKSIVTIILLPSGVAKLVVPFGAPGKSKNDTQHNSIICAMIGMDISSIYASFFEESSNLGPSIDAGQMILPATLLSGILDGVFSQLCGFFITGNVCSEGFSPDG
jgi:hypothetical protein